MFTGKTDVNDLVSRIAPKVVHVCIHNAAYISVDIICVLTAVGLVPERETCGFIRDFYAAMDWSQWHPVHS